MPMSRSSESRAAPLGTLHAVSIYSTAAASTRVRLYDWFAHLRRPVVEHQYARLRDVRPHTLTAHPGTVLRAERAIRGWDPAGLHVLLSREASPFSRGELEQGVLGRAARGVYDVDDAIFVELSRARRVMRSGNKFQKSVGAADAVIAGNEHLANAASRWNADITVIPSCIEPDAYTLKTDWTLGDPPIIAWLGSSTTERYLDPLADALTAVHRRTGPRLRLLSGTRPGPFDELDWVDRTPWSLANQARDLDRCDVAIAPLNDDLYARGKCAYKLLQYAASGLPAVGSPVGANTMALSRFGWPAAQTPTEWDDALTTLLSSPADERARLGRQARHAVEAHYSFASWAPTWQRVVDGAA